MRSFLFLLAACLTLSLCAQAPLGYQSPPKAILDLVDVPLAPNVLMDNAREHMVLLSRDAASTPLPTSVAVPPTTTRFRYVA